MFDRIYPRFYRDGWTDLGGIIKAIRTRGMSDRVIFHAIYKSRPDLVKGFNRATSAILAHLAERN